MKPTQQLEVVATIATMVEESSRISGRLRLQKLAYLLQETGLIGLSGLEFSYHYYGPYSEQLADLTKRAVNTGILEETSIVDYWQRFEYSLGSRGPEYTALTDPSTRQKIKEAINHTKRCHSRVLELAATAHFLQAQEGWSMREAMNEALELKADCSEYRDAAQEVLRNLQLD